jgi:class 3 adenylate cyclase
MTMEAWSGTPSRDRLQLASFVPAIVRRRIAGHASPLLHPEAEAFAAAVLLADLSGFSALAESFAQHGPRGAEDLKDVLSFFCGHLVDLVDLHGGEVLDFAGDAAVALWPAVDGDLSSAARRAAQCALAVQRAVAQGDPPHGVRLNLRCGIGSGDLWSAHVGGVADRWALLVAGEPLTQAVAAMSAATAGESAVSAAAWAHIAPVADGTPLHGSVRLAAIRESLPALPFSRVMPSLERETLLRAYVPRSVQVRLDADQSEWLAEFRRVTALFIRLDDVECGPGESLRRLQHATAAVQDAVYRHEGSLNQLLVDDKGTVVVCGWGLALHVHADDAARAVRAALDVRRELREAGFAASFGIATGDAFTGVVGTSRRCAYAMIGDVVNLAARLMQAAAGDILCDAASFDAASRRLAFESVPPLTLKGRERPVDAFRPVLAAPQRPSEIVGRLEERRLLGARLAALAADARGGVVFLEGDPGIGKSRLVADVIERAIARGIRTMVATGDAIERSAPYHLWCALFDSLLGLDGLTGRGGAERRIVQLLESNPRLVPFAPLLNTVLRLNFHDTDESLLVPPRGRALLTRELLVHLFRCATGGRATLLVLEDGHWLDSASWALAEAIVRELPEVLLLIAMHPAGDDQPAERQRLLSRDDAVALRLQALAPDEARLLVCQRLRVRALSEAVARLIDEKAEGHPFFAEELALDLRDRGVIRVESGVCRLSPDAAGTAPTQLPSTVQVVVSSRIDQLTISQQLTLKVASIFGRSFDVDALRAVYPIEVAAPDLDGHLDALVSRDLVRVTPGGGAGVYAFKHAITQEVAYSLLSYALRRQLHAGAAEWYERLHPDDLAPFYPLLAYHWSRAEIAERAVYYNDQAGEQALRRHANEEAFRFFKEALELDDKFATTLAGDASVRFARVSLSGRQVRRIRWERRLGDAATNLGRWEEGRRHFTRVLTFIGHPLPTSPRGLAAGVGVEIVIQGMRRIAPWLFSRPSSEAIDLVRQAVCAYERIGTISYQDGDMRAVVYSLIAGLNLAERLGATPELGLIYADVGNVLGLVPVPSLARLYHRMAIQTAAQLADPVMAARIRGRAAIYRLGAGDWSACADLEASMAACDQIGDSYLWAENAAIRARAAQLQGEFARAAALGAEVRARGGAHGAIPHQLWGLAAEAWAQTHLGRHETAIERAGAGLRLYATAGRRDRLALLDLHGACALAHLARSDGDAAYASAQSVAELMSASSPPGYFALLGMSAAAETCLAIWEAESDTRRGLQAAMLARRLCRDIARYARINPPARARLALWRGCVESLAGNHRRAHALWRQSLEEAERFALPYEEARAHYEIGRRVAAAGAVDADAHLARAIAGFERLGAAGDALRARRARRES